jgi:hypothetical protein
MTDGRAKSEMILTFLKILEVLRACLCAVTGKRML